MDYDECPETEEETLETLRGYPVWALKKLLEIHEKTTNHPYFNRIRRIARAELKLRFQTN